MSVPAVVGHCRTSDFGPEARGARAPWPNRSAPGSGSNRGWSAPPEESTACATTRTTCATGTAACSRPAARSPTRCTAARSRCSWPDCPVCLDHAAAVAAQRADARVLWLDAHADFNTPETTPSRFLGGMCLAGACGLWDPAARPRCRPDAWCSPASATSTRASSDCSSRPGRRLLDRRRRTRAVATRWRARPVFVHLDLDVLDNAVVPAEFPAPGGLTPPRSPTCSRGVGAASRGARHRDHVLPGRPTPWTTATPWPRPSPTPSRRPALGKDPMTPRDPSARLLRPLVEELHERRAKARLGGGEEKIASQHATTSSPRASGSHCSSTRARSPSSASTAGRTSPAGDGEQRGARRRRDHRLRQGRRAHGRGRRLRLHGHGRVDGHDR